MKFKNSLIFNISGGLGKNIIATAVVKALKKQHPSKDIIIVSPHRDAWLNNPNVKEIVSIVHPKDEQVFYAQNGLDSENSILKLEPYSSEDYFYKRKNLAAIWCDLYDIPYKKEKPELFITDEETESAKKKINFKDGDKIFIVQPSGGAPGQPYPISWARDLPLPIADEVCEKMKKAGYRVIHIRRKDQKPLKDTEWFELTARETFALIQLSNKRLLIDSFAQHAAAALNKPSVVTWVANSPKVFGYDIHTNILPEVKPSFRHTIDSFLEPYNIIGALHEYPYDTDRIYSVKKILEELK